MNNMPNLSLIEKMIENDELDSADRELTKLEKIIKAAQPADDDDDEDLEDDPAEEDDSDEDGEDEDDGMQKLGPRTLPPRYPHDDLTDAFVNHQNIREPMSRPPRTRHLQAPTPQASLMSCSSQCATLLMTRLTGSSSATASAVPPQCRARESRTRRCIRLINNFSAVKQRANRPWRAAA